LARGQCGEPEVRSPEDRTVLQLNVEHATKAPFVIELIYWEDIEMRLEADDVFRESYLVSSHASMRAGLRTEVAPLVTQLSDLREALTGASADGVDAELDRAKRLLEEKKHDAARALLDDLRTKKYDRLTALQRFRCLANLGVIEFEVRIGRTRGASSESGFRSWRARRSSRPQTFSRSI
jgi:hypothetical protein